MTWLSGSHAEDLYASYLRLALDMGARNAVVFQTDQLGFDARTTLKCMFGCDSWGKGHMCPSRPGSLSTWEYERVLRLYSGGVLVHAADGHVLQDVTCAVEKSAYRDGHYLAFSTSDCLRCTPCHGVNGEACPHPLEARPALHSPGIDVFATARGLGLPIEVLTSADDPQNWYGAVFVE